ncbi:MAG: hypothetical protein IJJ67_03070 [Oscillospiraceae bacterium]|nr:hypothetical protein [Oscillospiraceae bacterium]
MIEEKTFLSMANQLGCKSVKVRPGSELSVKLMCSEEDFLTFASNKTANIFYSYEYPEDHEIIITGKTFDEAKGDLEKLINSLEISHDFDWFLDEDIYPEQYTEESDYEDNEASGDDIFSPFEKELKRVILDSNAQTDIESLKKPRSFMAFYIDNGCLVGIHNEEPKPVESLAETKLYSLLMEYEDVVRVKREEAEQKKDDIREKLKDYLLEDIQFKISTNQKLRNEYARNLWENRRFKWIRDGFDKMFGDYPTNEYFLFIDRVFKEMKYMEKEQ